MYLLISLGYDYQNKSIIFEKGIKIGEKNDGSVITLPSFWGETEVNLDELVQMHDIEKIDSAGKVRNLPYVNKYFVKKEQNNFNKIIFDVSIYQPDNIEGYIIFSKNYNKTQTDGEILFNKYDSEIVVVLREEQYLKYDGGKIKCINGKLTLIY